MEWKKIQFRHKQCHCEPRTTNTTTATKYKIASGNAGVGNRKAEA